MNVCKTCKRRIDESCPVFDPDGKHWARMCHYFVPLGILGWLKLIWYRLGGY